MKKVYEKPVIVFESFVMSASIAAGCENKTNLPSQNQCGIQMEGVGMVFVTGMTGCTDFPVNTEEDSFNGICYHTPTEGNNLFTS